MDSIHPAGYSNVVTCPYDKAHQILSHRIQTHLVKCRKNYPNVAKKQCPFNTVHLINEVEFEHHVADCPDRASFDRYKYNVESTSVAPKKEEEALVFQPVDCEENWDDDDDVPSYDPQKYCQTAPVLRQLNVAPPSERNAFRDSERRRLNNLHTSRK